MSLTLCAVRTLAQANVLLAQANEPIYIRKTVADVAGAVAQLFDDNSLSQVLHLLLPNTRIGSRLAS